jgi:FAD/FMN-containing dehydrogenase
MKKKITIRKILLSIIILALLIVARPVGFLIYTNYRDQKIVTREKTGYTNDASHLSETKTGQVVKVLQGPDEAARQIAQLVKQAKAEGKKISIAGAQHSMGGHTIYPDGILLNMKGLHHMQLDTLQNILTVGAGALWSEIIPYLDKYGRSVSVMQSNNSFSVGGSVSVNCHGWQPDSAPVSSTVESFRLVTADGEIIHCSRTDHAELFSLVLGGYGLFGVILDVRLKVTGNKMYTAHQYIIKSDDYVKEFDHYVKDKPGMGLVYGRININPDHFMEEAILSTFSEGNTTAPKTLQPGSLAALRRTIFRGSVNSGYGKNLRWTAEKFGTSLIKGKQFARNQLMNEEVTVFENTDTGYTDILHEYFIPKDSAARFIKTVREILPEYKTDLLNITVRNVKKDEDTYLHYANEEVFGFVMLFNQARNSKAESEMKMLTQKLIDVAYTLRGTYYLPYRLHATKEQLYKVYPQAKGFFLLKKKYDPAEIFQNRFYISYK